MVARSKVVELMLYLPQTLTAIRMRSLACAFIGRWEARSRLGGWEYDWRLGVVEVGRKFGGWEYDWRLGV